MSIFKSRIKVAHTFNLKASLGQILNFKSAMTTYRGSVQKGKQAGQWWCLPLIPSLGRHRQVELCELEVGLVCIVSSSPVRSTQLNLSQKAKKKKQN